MNRPIKFRAWDRLNKQMVYPGTPEAYMQCDGDGCTLTVVTGVDIDRETGFESPNFEEIEADFMQFTGLTDKNGKEIYEGDVVRYTNQLGRNPRIYSIVFYEKTAAFVTSDLCHLARPKCYEVIGNIYENPELLTD